MADMMHSSSGSKRFKLFMKPGNANVSGFFYVFLNFVANYRNNCWLSCVEGLYLHKFFRKKVFYEAVKDHQIHYQQRECVAR